MPAASRGHSQTQAPSTPSQSWPAYLDAPHRQGRAAMNSNSYTRRQLDEPKKDRLLYRRLYWWADGTAKEIKTGETKEHRWLRASAATGWVLMQLIRYCYPGAIIRLWEKTGRDEYGQATGHKALELLKEKCPYPEKDCNKVLMCLRLIGRLHTYAGNNGYDLHSPVLKDGDIPQLQQEWPDEVPLQPGAILVIELKKRPMNSKPKSSTQQYKQ